VNKCYLHYKELFLELPSNCPQFFLTELRNAIDLLCDYQNFNLQLIDLFFAEYQILFESHKRTYLNELGNLTILKRCIDSSSLKTDTFFGSFEVVLSYTNPFQEIFDCIEKEMAYNGEVPKEISSFHFQGHSLMHVIASSKNYGYAVDTFRFFWPYFQDRHDYRNILGREPLFYACRAGNTTLALLMISLNVGTPDNLDYLGLSVLSAASFDGHVDVLGIIPAASVIIPARISLLLGRMDFFVKCVEMLVASNDDIRKLLLCMIISKAELNIYLKQSSQILNMVYGELNRTLLYDAIEHCDEKQIKFLIDQGANENVKDRFGVAPFEYAAYLGKFSMIKYLNPKNTGIQGRQGKSLYFGRNSDNQYKLILHLGSYDIRSEIQPFQIRHDCDNFNGYWLRLSGYQSDRIVYNKSVLMEYLRDLFQMEYVISFSDVSSAYLQFDIGKYEGSEFHVVASGTQMLDGHGKSVLQELQNIGGQCRITMSSKARMVGSLLFEYLLIKPNTSLTKSSKSSWPTDPILVGHRGCGKNRPIEAGMTALQLGENTLESLCQAKKFGAEFVEFDVQLTKDLVPVLYHNCNHR
jgi:hypothetical protein